jgi:hypothetical protein
MKVLVQEHEGCFSIDLSAEGIKDASILTRMALNSKKELRSLGSMVSIDGSFNSYIIIGKKKEVISTIKDI